MTENFSFKRQLFMDYMKENFSSVLNNHFTYDLLNNSISWLFLKAKSKESFIDSLKFVIPEVTEKEINMFIE